MSAAVALRRSAWRHPEWPWALAAAGAWAGLALAGGDGDHHMAMPVGTWMLMVVAMMVPATLPVLRAVALEGLWSRRHCGPALFLAGYVATWTLLGVVALAAFPVHAGPEATGAILVAAAAWELTRAKLRCLKRCHRLAPLPPRGGAADRACLRFGAANAGACVGACGPMMVAMVPSHSLALMCGLAALSTWERVARLPRLSWCATALAAVGLLIVAT